MLVRTIKNLSSIVLCLSFALQANASELTSPQQRDILKPIHMLFDGMREGNGDKVRAVFHPTAVMHRAHAKLREGGTPEKFAEAVDKPKDKVWDEKIWDIKIQRDDKLASVWTQFAFYLGDTLSHCGVNSFQLYQFEDGWKIIYLGDTFRKGNVEGNCDVPEAPINQ